MAYKVYPLVHRAVMRFANLYVREIKGLPNIPEDRGFLVASNHASYFDDAIIPQAIYMKLRKKTHIYTNSLYFKVPLLGNFLKHAGCIPIDVRKTDKARENNERGFRAAVECLGAGKIVGVFPEGHRSSDGNLQKAKLGTARLALAAKVPVVPVGVSGSYEILPKGKILPRFRKCTVNIGEPMHFEEYYGMENDKKALQEVTDKIMKKIALLAGKEYGPG